MAVLVGREAPDFTVQAALPNGKLSDHYNFYDAVHGKYSLVFFYPLDFTFVCPSELIALDQALPEFKKRNVEVVGVSIDSHFTHNAWKNTPLNKGGIGPVGYALAADMNHTIARSYGIEHPVAGVALRAAFVIDRDHIVRAQIINDLPLGRHIGEILRLFDALLYHEKHGEVCPANWKEGDKGMVPTSEGVARYLSGLTTSSCNISCDMGAKGKS